MLCGPSFSPSPSPSPSCSILFHPHLPPPPVPRLPLFSSVPPLKPRRHDTKPKAKPKGGAKGKAGAAGANGGKADKAAGPRGSPLAPKVVKVDNLQDGDADKVVQLTRSGRKSVPVVSHGPDYQPMTLVFLPRRVCSPSHTRFVALVYVLVGLSDCHAAGLVAFAADDDGGRWQRSAGPWHGFSYGR